MASIFDRDTILDITVNMIPLGIIAFFLVAFAVYAPFSGDSIYTYLQYLLLVAPFVGLAILTYFSAKAIETDARARDEEVHVMSAGAPLEADDTAELESGEDTDDGELDGDDAEAELEAGEESDDAETEDAEA